MLLFAGYLLFGYLLFREEVISFLLEISKEVALSMKLFLLLDLLAFWLFYPVEILINNFGGRDVWRKVVFIMYSPLILMIFILMMFERLVIEIYRGV